MDQLSHDMLEAQSSLGALKISPNGKYAAWVETRPSAKEDKYLYWLHFADLQKDKVFPLTSGGGENSFCWLDCDSLIFPALRAEDDKKAAADGEPLSVFYRIAVTGGEAREFFRIPLKGATALAVLGEQLLLSANYDTDLPNYIDLDEEGKKDYRKAVIERKKVVTGNERRYRADGMGYINGQRKQFYLYHLSTGDLKSITTESQNAGEYAVSVDGGSIIYCADVAKLNGETATHAIFCYDINSGLTKTVSADSGYQISKIALFKDKVYFWGSEYPYGNSKSKQEWLSISTVDGSVEKLDQGDYTVTSSYTSDATRMAGTGVTVKATDEALYMIRYHRRVSKVYRYTGSGEPEPITDTGLKVNFFDIIGDTLVCCGFDKFGLLEIFKINNGMHNKLTDFTANLTYTPSEPIAMMFTNSDGIEIDGWVVKPKNIALNEKIPAILMIHGGPHSEYSDILLHDLQYLVARGYAVMYCNPRGSIGRGSDFANISGKYGTVDWKDVSEFVDNVLARCPEIDPERVGVTGASYGGYMTNWLITHDHRFKAAVSQCCVSNWFTMYYVCDIPFFVRGEMGGTPEEIPEEYHRASPISYVRDVKTPTLFLQYDADYRCPIDQGIQMYNGLIHNGVDARIAIFSGDNHTMIMTGKPSSRIRRHEEIIGWFDKYLK